MPIATIASELNAGYELPLSLAGKMQILSYVGMPIAGATILTSGSIVSNVLPADGYQSLTVGITMNRAGTLLVTRWIDLKGTITRDATTTSIVANTLLIVDLVDNKPFTAFTVEIDNGAVGLATIANFAIIMNAD